MARRLTFDQSMLNLITNLKSAGKSDKEVGEIIGVNKDKICELKRDLEELKKAMDEGEAIGRDATTEAVERSLFARCLGYTYIEKIMDNKGKAQLVERHVPPDISAIKFWLKNRKGSDWKETQDVNHGVTPSTHALIVQGLQELDESEQSEKPELED